MKKCETCRYGSDYELDKPCIVYREDCPLYEKEGDEMNREEAIEVIKQDIPCEYDTDLIEALEMAIKALEQDNCPYYVIDEDGHGLCKNHRVLEQEPCNDAISRQYLLDNCIVDKVTMPYVPVNKIKEAPSVNPQEPKWNMLLNWLNDMRFGIAPDETVTDIDELHCREAQTDILDEIMEWMKKQTPKSKCLLSQKYRDWLFIQEPKESDHKCHDCKHYTSGENDGSCDSYICKGYSDWESEDKE